MHYARSHRVYLPSPGLPSKTDYGSTVYTSKRFHLTVIMKYQRPYGGYLFYIFYDISATADEMETLQWFHRKRLLRQNGDDIRYQFGLRSGHSIHPCTCCVQTQTWDGWYDIRRYLMWPLLFTIRLLTRDMIWHDMDKLKHKTVSV